MVIMKNTDTGIEVKNYKLKELPTNAIPNAILYIKPDGDSEIEVYVTDMVGVPYPLKIDVPSSGVQSIFNNDGTISVVGSDNVEISLSSALTNLINSALQTGDPISELTNDSGYITIADISGKLDKVSAYKVVYATDNSNNQTTIEYSSGAQLINTIVQRTAEGQSQSLTLSDTDVNAANNDLINRGYAQSLRNDRMGQGTLNNGGSYTISGVEDGVILSGLSINNYTVNLPSGYNKYKTVIVKFRAGVANLTVNPGFRSDNVTPNTIDWSPTQVSANYCYIFGYNWSAYDWEIVSKFEDDDIDFSNVVYINDVNPSTATIFDLNNPPTINDNSLKNDVKNLYIGTDGSTWTYKTSPAGYNTYSVSSVSNFYLSGGTVDAGSNKTNPIKRNGSVEATAFISTNEIANTIASFDSNKNIKSLPTSFYPDLTELSYIKGLSSSVQNQVNQKQIIDTQVEIATSVNVQNSWHGQTVLFTSNCTITVPATLSNSLMFPFRTLTGVTVTWAITPPFVWETAPSTTTEKTVGHFMRRGSTNTIFLDM